MNRKDFQEMMDADYRAIRAINNTKGNDYAGQDDALRNFKEQAATLKLRPEQVWAVLALKHWFAIMTYCADGAVQSEPIEGRLHDIILYSFLLLGLIREDTTD
jgi:hypothetical protein